MFEKYIHFGGTLENTIYSVTIAVCFFSTRTELFKINN